MKAERRHELQQNSLAQSITNLPTLLRVHGAKILLGIIIALLVAILIYQKTRRSEQQLQSGWGDVAEARMAIQQLSRTAGMDYGNPDLLFKARVRSVESIEVSLATVLAADDRQLAAQGFLLRGDLNWTLANLPEIPEATTRPTLRLPAASADYLKKAEDNYNKVVGNYADLYDLVSNARFGLASIQENRRNFDEAAKVYTTIKNDAHTLPSYKTLAEARLATLEQIKHPMYVAPTTQPSILTAPSVPSIPTPSAPVPPTTLPALSL